MNGKQLAESIKEGAQERIVTFERAIAGMRALSEWTDTIPADAEFPIYSTFNSGEVCIVAKSPATAHDVAGSLARQCGLVFERGIFNAAGRASIEYSAEVAGIRVKVWTESDPTCRLVAIPKTQRMEYEYKIECPGTLAEVEA